MMERKQILEMFSKRAPEMIKAWPEERGKNDPLDVPQKENRDVLIGAIKGMHGRKKITSVLDVGCGLGRWAPFWTAGGVNVRRYTGIEPCPQLAAEAEKRYEASGTIEIILGELTDVEEKLGKRKWDVGFTFTVLEHIPPSDVQAVADILKARTKRLVLIEMVQGGKGANFCEYVFKHDYKKLFGKPKFQQMLDANKALMIFE